MTRIHDLIQTQRYTNLILGLLGRFIDLKLLNQKQYQIKRLKSQQIKQSEKSLAWCQGVLGTVQRIKLPPSYRASQQWFQRYTDPRSGNLLLVDTDFKKALRILFKLSGNQQRTKTLKEKKEEREREGGHREVSQLLCLLYFAKGEFIGSIKEPFLEHGQNLDPLYYL